MRTALRLAALAASLALSAPSARAGEPATGIAFEGTNLPFAEVQAKAKAASKPIFIDFFTEWCGWCKKLDADVFAKPDVAEHMKAYLPVRYDAEQAEGKRLAARYHVDGFPTLLVVDAEGAEIDRIVGYRKPEAFVAEVDRIARGEGTLKALRAEHEKSPEDLVLATKYATKLADADPAAAPPLICDIVAKAEDKALIATVRGIVVRVADARASSDPQAALDLLARCARIVAQDRQAVGAAADVEARAHLALAARALARRAELAGDDPEALNAVAWSAFEHGISTQPATEWAQKAVELTQRKDAAILDTLANLLFVQGRVTEAIAVQKEAVPLAEGAMKHELALALAKFEAAAAYRKAAAVSEGDEGSEDEDGEEDEDGKPAPH